MKDRDYSAYSHAFLVVFFASMTCRHLDWLARSTTQKIALGAMLHDIGKMKIDPLISALNSWDMNEHQLEEYRKHPELGVEIIGKTKFATTEIKQIILQHHETMDGEGFPGKITGNKIYPLAHIVGFVDKIANIMAKERLSPLPALKLFLENPINLPKYNPKIIKAFLKCFVEVDIEL